MINLYHEAQQIAREAIKECGYCNEGVLEEYVQQLCDAHRVSFVYHEGITFCAEQNTSRGEEWLEDCGGIARDGDTFGQIACRIAYATLYVAAIDALYEMLEG